MIQTTTVLSPQRSATAGSRAFTLIELLIVVAIISILASIAVPNFLEAQTRAKVARVKNDQRTLVVGLEAYKVDTNRYPPRTAFPRPVSTSAFGDAQLRAEELSRITSPISYLSSLPVDVFERTVAPPNNVIDYWSQRILYTLNNDVLDTNEWVLVSVGPDTTFGGGAQMGNITQPGSGDPLRGSYRDEYDPTNGTLSGGNIYRIRSEKPAAELFGS